MPSSNQYHKWLKKRDWPAVREVIVHPDRDLDFGLLSLTPEAARSLGGKEMRRLYAPVGYWVDEMKGIQTVTSSSMNTMTSWCVKCSNTGILIFF